MPVTDVVIHHNPDCGTSRNVVRIVEAAGYRPVIVEYLKTGWTKPQLLALLADAGLTPRDVLRLKKSPAEELGLTDPSVADEDILEAMIAHPILVERPIVVTAKGTALCRPSETVLDLLDRWPPGPFAKEDGELVIDADGKRVG
ncbi:arsenate reductase (glutaredoxin) [Pleomorphomonas koreensis]|uniref:arsenate reductase (glutaredoxin) n=1 Tax=Pleomorphomonas koreensis TaxID=257440 RepID=UPI0004077B80|nr:arsenate reductase (glutaredoxin) [Pleomorphomonas koreensis]